MRELPIHRVQKVWGRHEPPAPFTNPSSEPLGEIWFDPPPDFSNLLVKYIFTSAALSVQVHPNDTQAPAGHRGKSECWYILDAEPGAQIAVGLKREMSVEELRAAALDGSIESNLGYFDVRAGDFFSIPAGTIHAIGAGISLLEVQQNSGITYRLYDYGRPRELHLEDGLQVSERGVYDPGPRVDTSGRDYVEFIDGPFFRMARVSGSAKIPAGRFEGQTLVLPFSDGVSVGGRPLAKGSCTLTEGVDGLALADGAAVALVEESERPTAR
ncbi:class I mannose-6-phosphate isomerase [Alteriqipengyuania lutimaris]|uniref:Mannose-6-phosphate isomerase n=1 Tax=Alteriqipengyuania lutimaris TaxID=1538146 RepID=A0A395LIG0_9SPHN|nr:class I mannose-6-phosphate isomerase [Alteriqipengyuania lutimaris]MBB3034329.1 mannose-6-phosphate isomerase [Alteriqipengyuania lutimaris]RDS76768.1 mannose-6-phosphate isomerase [Alteriqipengyuania lutimaris]